MQSELTEHVGGVFVVFVPLAARSALTLRQLLTTASTIQNKLIKAI
jgi:hypothetical protein